MNAIIQAAARVFDRRMSIADLDRVIDMAISGVPAWSGNLVSEQGALANAAVWSCVRVISESLASMPCHVFRRLSNGGKEVARSHYLYSLLHDQPNEEMTSFDYRALLFAHLLTWGNHFSLIEWDMAQRVKALWPLTPDRMKVERKNEQAELTYSFRKLDGTWMPMPIEDIFHVRGLGFDGIRGYPVIQLHRNTIGASDAVNEFGARFFANGTRPSGTLTVPGSLSESGQKNLRESFAKEYVGLKNAHRAIVLEGGVTFTATSVPPNDAQFLETRKLNRTEIAGIFRVPPHMIGDLERATFSNIEQQSLEFVTYTLVPWMCRFEAESERVLMTSAGRANYFVELDANGLMRGDAGSRSTYYKNAIVAGWMMPNEARNKENMNPDKAGDVYFRPLNTAFVDRDGNPVAVTPEDPTIPAVADEGDSNDTDAKAA